MSFGRETEVRKLRLLSIAAHYGLVEALDSGSAWKQVMALVRRIPTDSLPCPIKYTTRHIKMIEDAGEKQKRSCAEIFLEEWGCSGRKRPTLADLLNLLKEAELYKAADYVAIKLLKESRPSRPSFGPAAEVLVPLELLNRKCVVPTAPPAPNPAAQFEKVYSGDLPEDEPAKVPENIPMVCVRTGEKKDFVESIKIEQQQATVPIEQIYNSRKTPQHILYDKLRAVTNDFDCNPVGENNGRLLGKGAFGTVHLAIEDNVLTAVKRLNVEVIDIDRLFQNELEALLRLEHPNLLRMVAYSNDGPEKCLVYEYMSQGNLEERLSCKGRWSIPLTYSLRLKIALGVSVGLQHLHEHQDPPLVHRDVKSANILLDKDLIPKLGDFGLVRLGDSSYGDASVMLTSTVFGTSVYMAPEAMRGEVTVKIDVFSIGVVLLELLTGLSPYDADGDGLDLVTYIMEVCDVEAQPIDSLLDGKAGNWKSEQGTDLSKPLLDLALECLEDKDKRPVMSDVVQKLRTIIDL
ncbi:Interleukin-1 receptor-associated kinase 4 [Frankliniella fusca]|uniref:non-specific serine/threonine protein kinase n=1 Tax=Frankliniella fusca TaxID=407009 RepID=A0AAE1LIZ9_9NEOP|nr:Interleukin-1 receptor-associated kinase 4 [Frankliniella fusca]